MDIYTLGHSTLSIQDFLAIIEEYEIEVIVDVRSQPYSKKNPQFNQKYFEKWLNKAGYDYLHLEDLGGRRSYSEEVSSELTDGWDKQIFKNYASYTFSDNYKKAIDKLISLSKEKTIAIMCANLLPWNCHRLLIANTLTFKNLNVVHIVKKDKLIEHELGMYGARTIIKDDEIIYPKV